MNFQSCKNSVGGEEKKKKESLHLSLQFHNSSKFFDGPKGQDNWHVRQHLLGKAYLL